MQKKNIRFEMICKTFRYSEGAHITRLIGLANIGEENILAALKETTCSIGIELLDLIIGLILLAILAIAYIIKARDLTAGEIHPLSENYLTTINRKSQLSLRHRAAT